MAIKLGGSSGGGSGDSSWGDVLLLVPFDSDTTDVKSAIAPTVSGSAIAITGSGKFGSYGANTASNTSSYSTGAFGGGDWTVELWLNRESFFDTNAKIIDLGAVELEASGGDDINFYHVTSDTNFGTTANSFTQGQWFHIAIVYDGGTLRSYVDGVQLGSLTTSVSDPTSVVLGNTASFDDLRVTASARYPGGTTFTPPAAAHPSSGAGSTGDIAALYLGSTAVSAAYLGSTSIWSAGGGGVSSITPGNLYGWGDNDQGQLGDGSTTDRSYALGAVDSNLWVAAAVSLESGGHALAIRDDGTLYAAGNNFFGYFLNSVQYTSSSTWVLADSGSWKSVGAGSSHSVGVKVDGTLVAAGYNTDGQLGSGNNTDNHIVTQIGSATDWATAYAARNSSYAIKSDGTLWSWGDNVYGQLGDGSTTDRNAPVQVGSATWTRISPNRFHTLGLQTDGTLWAWGTNSNRFGDGTTNNSNTPVQIGSDTWLDIAAGRSHSVGIKSDGTLWGWGYSTAGAHGSGTATLSSPTQIGSNTNWAKVAAGDDHSAAIDSSGIRYLFGSASNNRSSGATTPTAAGTDIWSLIVTQGTSSLGIAVAP